MNRRYALLGLAPARASWFRELARWSTNGAIAADFVKCVSVEEVALRLQGDRRWSALLVDAEMTGADRDLVELARRRGCAVFGVGARAWDAVGVDVVLAEAFSPDELRAVVEDHAEASGPLPLANVETPRAARGVLVAVCGSGGTGTSTIAMAAAQGLARDGGPVLLADLARHAQQALLHDTRELGPGLPELVDAFRVAAPDADLVRSLTISVPSRRYDLLLGLRRASDWTALRPRALAAAVDAMTDAYGVVVADVDADVEGYDESGSTDVEDRNAAARTTIARADVVLAVGSPGTAGVHALVRVVRELAGFGVEPARIVPVVNRVRARRRGRAEVVDAVGALVSTVATTDRPLVVPEHPLEDAVRDAVPVARPLADVVARRIRDVVARVAPADITSDVHEAVLVAPGSLGSWHDEEAG